MTCFFNHKFEKIGVPAEAQETTVFGKISNSKVYVIWKKCSKCGKEKAYFEDTYGDKTKVNPRVVFEGKSFEQVKKMAKGIVYDK